MPMLGSSVTGRQRDRYSLGGTACPAELGRTVEDFAQRVPQDWRQVCGLVAARRLVPPRLWWRLHTQQVVQRCRATQPVGKRPAAHRSELVQEGAKCLILPAAEHTDLLLRAWGGQN